MREIRILYEDGLDISGVWVFDDDRAKTTRGSRCGEEDHGSVKSHFSEDDDPEIYFPLRPCAAPQSRWSSRR
jgi:hypothetical protein